MKNPGLFQHNQENKGKCAPFFVLGCPRSGTTLLSRILNSHPRIGVPFESQFFPNFYRQIHAYGDLSQPERMKILIRHMVSSERVQTDWGVRLEVDEVFPLLRRSDFGGAFEAVLTAWATRINKPRWGEKTPQNAHYGKALVRFFPSAKYLHIFRDGRDVALSLAKTPFGPKSSYHAARYWLMYLNEIEEIECKMPASQFLALRYEDLISAPEKVLVKVCHFLDEDYDENMLNFFKVNTPANIEKTNRANLQKPLNGSNKNKWKGRMSLSDLNTFESIAGDKLAVLGYERMLASPSMPKMEYLKNRYLVPWPQRMSGMLRNHKAQREFLFRLKNRVDLFFH